MRIIYLKLRGRLETRASCSPFRSTGTLACLVFCLAGCAVSLPPGEITFTSGETSLHGDLYLPEGVGPHPVLIDLHGCDGILEARNRAWLPEWTGAGFAVLQVDSFTPRGVTGVCGDPFRVSPMTRSMDAAAALRWVMRDGRFERDAVFLVGASHGATASLLTQLDIDSVFSGLAGIIAFYPYCHDELPALSADLLVLIGDLDDWTPAARCRDMRIRNRGRHDYELVVYPGAHHSFDVPGLDFNHFGHRVRYNAPAAEDSVRRVMDFLNARLGR